jgi:hypothetical protein
MPKSIVERKVTRAVREGACGLLMIDVRSTTGEVIHSVGRRPIRFGGRHNASSPTRIAIYKLKKVIRAAAH